jgi:hypothetical protein
MSVANRRFKEPSFEARFKLVKDGLVLQLVARLRSKLDALEQTRETARRELASLAGWRESLQTLERDKELLLESYAMRAPAALADLKPEERRTVYSMLGLRVEALPEKSLRVRGAFGEESLVCQNDRTSRRSFTDANPPASKSFGFTLILREGTAPKTAFRIVGSI